MQTLDQKDQLIARMAALLSRIALRTNLPLSKCKTFFLAVDALKDKLHDSSAVEFIDQLQPLMNEEIGELMQGRTDVVKGHLKEIELLRNKNAELRNVINRLEAFAFADDPRGARDYIRDHVKGKV